MGTIIEAQTGKQTTPTTNSWRILRELDPTRGQDEELQDVRRSSYWISSGRNSSKIYNQDVRTPFSEDISTEEVQQKYQKSLDWLSRVYESTRTEDPSNKTSSLTIIGDYTHTKLGRPTVVATYQEGVIQSILHTWVQPEAMREKRLR